VAISIIALGNIEYSWPAPSIQERRPNASLLYYLTQSIPVQMDAHGSREPSFMHQVISLDVVHVREFRRVSLSSVALIL
jgi:hypothetical protein